MWRDLRFAVRLFRQQPGFLVGAVLSLAFGMAASTVMFTFIKAVFLPVLPVQDPAALMMVYSTTRNRAGGVTEYQSTAYLNAKDYQARNNVFSGLAVIVDTTATLEADRAPRPVLVNLVSADYFHVLGVRPALGRAISPADDNPAASPVIVVTHRVWREQLGSDPVILGKSVRLNRQQYTVIGVMPASFHDAGALPPADVWVPVSRHEQVLVGNIRAWFDLRSARVAMMVGRLKPGVSVRQAQAAMNGLGRQLEAEFPNDNAGRNVMVVPLEHTIVPPSQRPLYGRAGLMLAVVVAAVLLIACSNVANLLLARAVERRKEFAIRASLGASRRQILRQVITESVLLAVGGGGLGFFLAYWVRTAVVLLLPGGLPPNLDVSFDIRVVLFTVVVCVLVTIVFGLAPALQASSTTPTMRSEGAEPRTPRLRSRLASLFVVAQVSLALVATVTAALFGRSFGKAQQTNLGYDLRHQVVTSLDLGGLGYPPERARAFNQSVVQRLRALPVIDNASLADTPPLGGTYRRTVFSADVDTSDPSNGQLSGIVNVAPGFFATVGMRRVRGRDFDDADDIGAAMVAIVNETAAKMFWRGEEPLGKRLRFLLQDWDVSVVGVVNTVTSRALDEPPQPIIYFPLKQHIADQQVIYVRAHGEPSAAVGTLRALVTSLEPGLESARIETGDEILSRFLAVRRLGAELLAAFGFVALMLATIGTYGIVWHDVRRRRREIAIRLALGAARQRIVRQLLVKSVAAAIAGVLVGLVVAVLENSAVERLLYGIGAFDVVSFASSASVLLLTALAACAIPAWRATQVDATNVLRSE